MYSRVRELVPMVVIAAMALSACTTNKRPDEKRGEVPAQEVNLDPMLIRPSDDGKPTEAIDVDDLFQRAYADFSARRYEKAAEDYQLIIRHFPDSRFFLPALYNAGLAYEKLERWREAAEMYEKIIDRFPKKEDTTDAYYRLAQAHEHMKNWPQVVELMTQVLLRPELTTFDRIEAHVRRSHALFEMEEYEEASDGYRTVLKINRDAPPEDRVESGSHFIVRSYFGLGRIYHHHVRNIELVLPPKRMGEDLKQKAELFMHAQTNYIRALSYHHPRWSMAAGYMIGRLYEDFYTDILAAEVPDDLSDEQLALYFEELRKQIRPLMERAVQVYEKNLSLSERIGTQEDKNEWVAETSEHLQRLKAYLEDPRTQKRAERFVRQGRDLENLWDPMAMARDHVLVAQRQARETITPEPEKEKKETDSTGTEGEER